MRSFDKTADQAGKVILKMSRDKIDLTNKLRSSIVQQNKAKGRPGAQAKPSKHPDTFEERQTAMENMAGPSTTLTNVARAMSSE